MKNVKNARWIFLCLSVLAGQAACGQALPAPGLFDADARAGDPRLNALVKLDADRMCLGEILEKVSAQTGVSVSIPATDPLSGIPITCHVKNLSLAELLNSLWSLVGFSRATWQITMDVGHKPRNYRFLPTPQARMLADLLSKQSDAATENLWKLYRTISVLPPKERLAYIKPLTAALHMDSEDWAKRYLPDTPDTNVIWDWVSLIPTELSAEQQEQLQKGVGISIPLSSMTPAHQEMMRPYIGHSYITRDGVRTELPPTDHMTFKFSRSIGSTTYLIRNLWIGVNHAEEYGGLGILGPLEIGLKQGLADGWILPGDARTSEKEAHVLKALPPLPTNTTKERTEAFDLVLKQTAEAQDTSYLAIVPDEITTLVPLDVGKPMSKLFADLQLNVGLMHKWRNGVLLYNYQMWFYGDEGLSPYSVTLQLRKFSTQRGDKQIPLLKGTGDAFLSLNAAQAKRLLKEFPEVALNQRLQPIFLLYKKYPGILAEEGQAVDLNMLTMMMQLKLIPPAVHTDDIESVRIVASGIESSFKQPMYTLQFRILHQAEWKKIERFQLFRPLPSSP